MRINKFIANNSQISRRKADELILEGKVFVNGEKVQTPGIEIDPETDKVKIDNETIELNEEKIYLALNKPAGYISTRKDEQDRKTIMELVPEGKNLKPVGRLDKDTEGLIILSNDGEFINKLTHPKFECEKEYYTIIKGTLTGEEKRKLENGIMIEGIRTSNSKIHIIKEYEKQTVLTIIIHEGRNRQIRKMFASVSHDVKYLQRIRIDKIKLGTLAKGNYRILTNNEIDVN